jgi:hypothetical protein
MLPLNIDLVSVMQAGRWKANQMPMWYGEQATSTWKLVAGFAKEPLHVLSAEWLRLRRQNGATRSRGAFLARPTVYWSRL